MTPHPVYLLGEAWTVPFHLQDWSRGGLSEEDRAKCVRIKRGIIKMLGEKKGMSDLMRHEFEEALKYLNKMQDIDLPRDYRMYPP